MREFTLLGLLAYAIFAIFFSGCDPVGSGDHAPGPVPGLEERGGI